jgi:hypothetical protein
MHSADKGIGLEESAEETRFEPRALQELIRFAEHEKLFGQAEEIEGPTIAIGSTAIRDLTKETVRHEINAALDAGLKEAFGIATERLRPFKGQPPGKYADRAWTRKTEPPQR